MVAQLLCSVFIDLLQAILASIVWVALYGMFKQYRDLYKYWKLSWWDAVGTS